MGVAEGLGSRKLEVLADTAVTLEQGQDGLVACEVIKQILSVSSECEGREGGMGEREGGMGEREGWERGVWRGWVMVME